MTAREQLESALDGLRAAVQSTHLHNASPPKQPEDDVARFARNGLAVVAFAVLEEFLRERLRELMAEASKSPAAFGALPESLRQAATENVVSVLANEIRQSRRAGAGTLSLIQEAGEAIASTNGTHLSISRLSLLWTGSNASPDDVSSALRRLQVEQNPWQQMTALAKRFGFLYPDLRAVFVDLQSNRHRAAHQASVNVDLISVRALPADVLSIAIAFDAIASLAVRRVRDGDRPYLGGTKVSGTQVTIRYLDWQDTARTRLSEHSEGSRRAYRVFQNLAIADQAATARARTNAEVLVLRDETGAPMAWRNGILP